MSRAAKRVAVLLLAALEIVAGSHSAPAQSPKTPGAEPHPPDSPADHVCRSCHADTVEQYQRTAHFLSSRLPDATSILGSFSTGQNILKTANPKLVFKMDEGHADGNAADGRSLAFSVTAVEGVAPYTTSRTERIAFVIGSGGKGQTYLFWKNDALFELPVSFWRELGWVNSPGYRDGSANFDRPIVPRCLECHANYFKSVASPNHYSSADFSLGIQCEKCHGPGRNHVEREQSKPPSTSGAAILNPSRFSRERQLDLCAWCHGGLGQSLLPAFSYLPGEPLAKYLDLPAPDPNAPLDVHGNQVEMLKRSRCFAASTMTCLTCHNVHLVQHDLAEFSRRCLACHKPESSVFAKAGHPISDNCIDCHMPRQETNLIVFDSNGARSRPLVRNHWIKVYPRK